MITNNLDWNPHKNSIVTKANKDALASSKGTLATSHKNPELAYLSLLKAQLECVSSIGPMFLADYLFRFRYTVAR